MPFEKKTSEPTQQAETKSEDAGFLGGKYKTAEELEGAYKDQQREFERIQTEQKKLTDDAKTYGPLKDFLGRPGALDAVEAYMKQGAPAAEPEPDPELEPGSEPPAQAPSN